MFLDEVGPYDLEPSAKEEYLRPRLQELLEHHQARCAPYARVVADQLRWSDGKDPFPADYPFLPVTVFKEYDLKSTDEQVMSVKSSATTSGTSSRIYVDQETRKRQTLSAHKIWCDYLGEERRPYIVFDVERSVRGRASMSARGAAVLSLAHHASSFHFVMKQHGDDLTLDHDALETALEQAGDQPFLAYGFTYILYQAHQQLLDSGFSHSAHPGSAFLHSGGWKRLIDLAVDKPSYNRTVSGVWGLPPTRVVDFYGSVEQVGVPYPDCAEGYKHVPYWGELVVRRSDSFQPADVNETGLLQLINTLPLSAPNHSVLTEDLGEVVLRDGCSCGRRGPAFVFKGRAPQSEVRGCSDVGRR